ncbi:MAG: hypothetical protein LAO04_03510 [Acidobacteriia bacterium]|nr:hypothetical protein [Terriglobia bacterium]
MGRSNPTGEALGGEPASRSDSEPDTAPFGVMLYGSAEVFLVSENILALPSTCLF